MQQKDNENSQTNQKEFISVQHQILVTNLQGYLSQLERKINNQILGVKGLIIQYDQLNCFGDSSQDKPLSNC